MEGWNGFGYDSAGSGSWSAGGGWGCLGLVGVVEAGEAVGDDLSCGFGCGFGGLLIGELLGGGGLSLCGRCAYSEVVLGRKRQVGLSGGDDENLFELVEVRCRTKLDKGVGLVIG